MVFSSLLVLCLIACGDKGGSDNNELLLNDVTDNVLSDADKPVENASLKNDRLEPFKTAGNFNAYVARLIEARQQAGMGNDGGDSGAPKNASPEIASPDDGKTAPSGLTNNQEAGVDEGGIVKAIGDSLIILRRGRLFSVLVNNGDNGALELRDTVDAFPAGHLGDTFYDELLVYSNKIIVVGYSKGYGATEIGEFVLADDGRIFHQGTYFLRSNDYYSQRNYTSRLVGDKLVFYMPFYFSEAWADSKDVILPGQAKLQSDGTMGEWQNIIDTSSLIQPIEETLNPVLHTIAICDLSAPEFSCEASAVVGPYSRTYYVSPNAVFLWTNGQDGASVYRLPLDGSGATVSSVVGSPADQFSFKEADDGTLHVLLHDNGLTDGPWAPESQKGYVALLSIPLTQFSAQPIKATQINYKSLPKVDSYSLRNRFVGDHVLYGADIHENTELTTHALTVYNINTQLQAIIPLTHDVERIEVIGDHAVVIGARGNDLSFSSVDLGKDFKVNDTYTLKDSAQGEHRSHGFFYKSLSDTSGILGLPVRKEKSPLGELRETSASVQFLSVDQNHFTALGTLESARKRGSSDDDCQFSCTDWYGNSRPIFWGDRIFALLGYDLIEGSLLNGALAESQRLDFTPKQQK